MSQSVEVITSKGPIPGYISYWAGDGMKFYEFRNIPYAKIPRGRLRFAPPEEMKSWLDSRILLKASKKALGDNNVLLLNIYTPELKKNESDTFDRAVVVFVPGDLTNTKYHAISYYEPQLLIKHDVVVVNVSYRSGIFGFLKFDDPRANAPGDVGLRDLKAAFHWIREEIVNFGGCPNNLTAFGKGLGASHLRHLLRNPMFENSFDKAIFSSCIEHKPVESVFFKDGCYIGTAVAKGVSSYQEKIEQRRINVSQNELKCLEYLQNVHVEYIKQYNIIITGCSIVNIFDDEDIQSILRETYQSKIPIIIGYNSQESIQEHKVILKYGNIDYRRLDDFLVMHGVRNTWPYWHKSFTEWTRKSRMTNYKQQLYEDTTKLCSLHLTPITFFSIISYIVGVIALAKNLASAMSPKKVYLYRFEVDLSLNQRRERYDGGSKGAAHNEDLRYIFKKLHPRNCLAHKVAQRITKLWTQFAKTEDPNPPKPNTDTSEILIKNMWMPINEEKLSHCLKIRNFDAIYREIPEKVEMECIDEILFNGVLSLLI